MSDGRARLLRRLSHGALVLLVTLVFAALASAVLALPPGAAGLSAQVDAELPRVGTGNPVTATLLDFRSYDTLLEMAVLLLAVTAIRALRRGQLPVLRSGDEILAFLGRVLVPVMILVAGYLLAAGLDAPGGAFQAGAIAAAAGVLLILAGRSVPLRDESLPIRLGLATGLAAFVAVGIAGMLAANAFLDYPPDNATNLMTVLEVAVSVSVALTLFEMFVSVLRCGNPGGVTDLAGREER